MTSDVCLPTIGRNLGGDFRGASPTVPFARRSLRCADEALTRREPIHASAVPYVRYLLLEVPGFRGDGTLAESRLGADLARHLGRAAAGANANILQIRRPGRPRPVGSDRAAALSWAIVDTSAEPGRVLWGTWKAPSDLLGLDLTAPIPATAADSGPQRVAVVCTNGKRDQCCAIKGRPVAQAVATATGWDTWESSHLGGHRFAATLMLLPTGDMFGWLEPDTAVTAIERFDAGQLMLPYYRGRSGQPFPAQAALHAAAVRLADTRRQAFRVTECRPLKAGADLWAVGIAHHAPDGREVAYRVIVAGTSSSPAFLSCADDAPRAEVHYTAVAFSGPLTKESLTSVAS